MLTDKPNFYELANDMLRETNLNGGATRWFLLTATGVTKGYVVAEGTLGLKMEHVSIAYIAGVLERWYDKGYEGVGFWLDGSYLYVDPVSWHDTKLEAIVTSIVRGELAFYDIERAQSCTTEHYLIYPVSKQ